MLESIAAVLEIVGAALVALAGIGILRFPDALTRATAVSKAAVLGVALLLVGAAADNPSWRTGAVVALVLVAHLITVPLSGMALGRAAYLSGTARPPVTRLDEPAERARAEHGPEGIRPDRA